jgi:hypothetical protein
MLNGLRISDCGFRFSDCFDLSAKLTNPQSQIRNPKLFDRKLFPKTLVMKN